MQDGSGVFVLRLSKCHRHADRPSQVKVTNIDQIHKIHVPKFPGWVVATRRWVNLVVTKCIRNGQRLQKLSVKSDFRSGPEICGMNGFGYGHGFRLYASGMMIGWEWGY